MTTEADIRVLVMNNAGRIAVDSELRHYVDLVDQGWSLGDVAHSMRNGPEASNLRQMVTNAYRTFLGREPEPGAVDFHITSAYRTFLNREPTPEELYSPVKDLGNISNQIIKPIRQSPEAAAFAKDLKNYVKTYTNTSGGKDDLVGYATADNFKYDTSVFTGFGDGSAEYLGALDHWNRYGKNEGRIIAPAEAPLIYIKNGNLKLAQDKYFSPGAKKTFENIIKNVKNSNGGNYKQLITNAINSIAPPARDNLTDKGGIDAIGAYYLENKVTSWDPVKQGAQPPVGGFDAEYYAKQAPSAVEAWNNAPSVISLNGKTFADLDITGRYTYETYLQQHYTNTGRYSGLRANAAVEPERATGYEEKLTDQELATYRDSVLGLDKKGEKEGDWEVDWEDPTDSILEQQVTTVLQSRDAQEQARFGALTQDALKQASDELLKVKKQEANLDLFRGLPGFNDIFNVNETLANSLLGDSGVGGVLSIMGKGSEEAEEGLAEQFSALTGVPSRNSTIYNWQKWFDDTLVKRYEEMTEIADPADADAMLEVDTEFAQTFIKGYLKPRFDQSKSMDEFISYMDVKEEEQNIFQTQDAINALKQTADSYAKTRYDQLKNASGGGFDADFYFNPTTDNEAKQEKYEEQQREVAKDWDDAKNKGDTVKVGDHTWNQWAYYYGLDITNRDAFAKLHYQVKGWGKDFDPAKDITSPADLQNYITTTVVPAVEKANLEIGDQPFLQFITPEEFADSLLEAVNPLDQKEEWKKLLEMYGLDPETASVEEVRDYIIEALRTNQGQDIRESIKYLNERKLTPTQYRLGVSYIERPEDKKTVETGETPLYKVFKESGYGGTEEEFYAEFMPDTSKSEQQFLGKALSGDLKLNEILSDDPFEALGNLSSLFQEEETDIFGSPTDQSKESDDTSSESSYFRLFEDDEISEKSDSAQSYIDEFTSLFKGFD